MAFLGLVPGEYSSGNSIRPRGITKVGNSELRRLLYEAAWSYRTPAKVGAWLIYYRPDSVTQYSKDIAWKAQQRLCSRYRSLTAKGKKSQVAITAVARELTGFMGYCTCCPIIIQSAEAKLNPEAVRHGMSDPRKRIQEVRMRQYLHIERGQLTA